LLRENTIKTVIKMEKYVMKSKYKLKLDDLKCP